MSIEHHLIVEDGTLYIPLTEEAPRNEDGYDKMILVHIYPEGDCDKCCWPFQNEKDKEMLVSTLNDEGNMDRIKPGKVFLPDGSLFGEIVPCGFNPVK